MRSVTVTKLLFVSVSYWSSSCLSAVGSFCSDWGRAWEKAPPSTRRWCRCCREAPPHHLRTGWAVTLDLTKAADEAKVWLGPSSLLRSPLSSGFTPTYGTNSGSFSSSSSDPRISSQTLMWCPRNHLWESENQEEMKMNKRSKWFVQKN